MNQKVEEFLAKAKEEKIKQAERDRRRILVSAGLFEKETVYNDAYSDECPYYDNVRKVYYGIRKNLIDVTDEEYVEICKYVIVPEDEEDRSLISVNDGAEKTLNTVATIILICGIIASFICFVTLCFQKEPAVGYSYITETKFDPSGLGIAFSVLIISIATWAIMRVLANISITLRELNSKFRRK